MFLSMAACIVGMLLFLHITFYVSGLTSRSGLPGFFMSLWSELSEPLVCMLLWLGVAVLASFIERAWKRLERLRFSAASGNERLRALNQPWLDAEALQLPITITLRMARICAFSAALVFFIAMLLFLLVTDLVNPVGRTLLANWPVNVIALIVLAGSAWGMYVLSMRKRTRIEVSANGIRVYQNKYVDACVSWQDARLFACYATPVLHHPDAALIYELSSRKSLVRWSCAQRAGSPWQMWAALIPFEEHRAQMHALAALITARTGLTLYDLRREPQ